MSYKDLNVYQKAYNVAIDLHKYLEHHTKDLNTEEIQLLKHVSREIIGNIAEGHSQRTPKAKRFYNFKALDDINKIMIDIDFLHDVKRFDTDKYTEFYGIYHEIAEMLYKINLSILEHNPLKNENKTS